MPECDTFISNAWHDLGMCSSGMDGMSRLSFQEVKAYSDSVCELDPFEVSTIVKMSQDYVNEQSAATKDKLRVCDMENDKEFYHKLKAHNKAEISKKMRMLSATAKK